MYLHIGSPKSGTTFLQNVLWKNRPVLAEQGVLLPGRSFTDHEHAAFDLRGLEQDPDDPAPRWKGRWDELAAEIPAERPRTAVVSHEMLAAVGEAEIGRVFESLGDAEVHVVYTMRDLAGLLPSEWQEYVKHRTLEDYATWLSEVIDGGPEVGAGRWFWRVHDAVEVLRRWSAGLPPERVHVVTMPPPGSPRDLLWRRFAGLVGIDPDAADLTGVRANAAIGVVEAELLRRINHEVAPGTPDWLYTRTVTEELAHKVLPHRSAAMRRVPFPEDRADWVRARGTELVDGLRAAGYDVVGDLAELTPAPRPGDHSPVTDADLLAAAVDGILGLLDRVEGLRGELAEARAELADIKGKPLPKAVVRHVSERNRAMMRARVAYWHLVERIRGDEPVPEPEGPRAAPSVWSRAPGPG